MESRPLDDGETRRPGDAYSNFVGLDSRPEAPTEEAAAMTGYRVSDFDREATRLLDRLPLVRAATLFDDPKAETRRIVAEVNRLYQVSVSGKKVSR